MAGKSRRDTRGYTLRGKKGQINYIGETSSDAQRQKEHRRAGKSGSLQIETAPMTISVGKRLG